MQIKGSDISWKNLSILNQKGWVPGPKEKEKAYYKRIEALNHFFEHPPSAVDHFVTDGDWVAPLSHTEDLFDFSPDWIVAHYSNQGLAFFQGGATWIVEKEKLRIPLVQLREKLDRQSLFKVVHREELLAHEAVHAVRMQFDEPLFEEFFAYQTSKRGYRRFFGPLFQKPWEAHLFIWTLFIPIVLEISLFFIPEVEPYYLLAFIPLAIFTLLLLRLCVFKGVLSLALQRIRKRIENPKKALAVAVRLTDSEIFQFAFSREKNLNRFFLRNTSPRHRLVQEIYFKKS